MLLRRWTFVACTLALLLLYGCSNIKNQLVTMETLDQVAVQVHQSSLSDPEKRAFDELSARANSGDYDVTNKTVGTLIADQQAYDADQAAQAMKQAKLEADARALHDSQVNALKSALTVGLVSKGFRPADYENAEYQAYLTLELALRNNSGKTIRAVKGTIDFETPLGDSIYQSQFEDSDSIIPHHTEFWDGTIDYNQFNDAQTRFRDADLHNIRLNWEPQTILFTDGSKLEVTAP